MASCLLAPQQMAGSRRDLKTGGQRTELSHQRDWGTSSRWLRKEGWTHRAQKWKILCVRICN
jgi:hypothetical protein